MSNPWIGACADVHPIRSPAAQAELARRGLSHRDLKRALKRHQAVKHIRLGTLIGLTERGLMGATRRGWRPGRHQAIDEFLIHLSWERIRKLLGRAPDAV